MTLPTARLDILEEVIQAFTVHLATRACGGIVEHLEAFSTRPINPIGTVSAATRVPATAPGAFTPRSAEGGIRPGIHAGCGCGNHPFAPTRAAEKKEWSVLNPFIIQGKSRPDMNTAGAYTSLSKGRS